MRSSPRKHIHKYLVSDNSLNI